MKIDDILIKIKPDIGRGKCLKKGGGKNVD